MKTKIVYTDTTVIDGHTYKTEVRKPLEYSDDYQVSTAVQFDGNPKIRDYSTHVRRGWDNSNCDNEVVSDQLGCIHLRLDRLYPEFAALHDKWWFKIAVRFRCVYGWYFDD